jgi:REP element-mobilizing transposase RayT
VYHVFTRGNRKGAIVFDDLDRRRFLGIVADVVTRRRWNCIGYCLMTNHYHLLVETPDDDLSAGMHALNGHYAKAFNRRHGVSGHLFEKRFSAVPAESNWHLLELCRYVVLNPVDAGLCAHPREWPWSSYRACVGLARPEPFLDVERLLSLFGRDRARARRAFELFVEDGIDRVRAA